jgi:hypothetical protein
VLCAAGGPLFGTAHCEVVACEAGGGLRLGREPAGADAEPGGGAARRSHAASLRASSFEHLLQLLRPGDCHQLLRAAPMQRAPRWRGADAWARPAQARRDWGLVHNAATLAAMEARL